jgi:ABC-type glycerol-3-phosphate transport system permease component
MTARRLRRYLGRVVTAILLALLTLVFLIPLLWMLGSSFRTQDEIFQYVYPLTIRTFVPVNFTLDNYQQIFVGRGFSQYLWNSFITSAIMTVISWYLNSAASFGLSRLAFRGRNVLYLFIITTMLIPLDATVVPTYIVASGVHLQNTLAALVIPWLAEPFAIFLLKQVIDEIPRELDDAAYIDGASIGQVYWHVALPNIRAAQITVAILKFLWAWSAFFWPLVIIDSTSKMVLPVAIATLFTASQTFWGQIFAGSTVAVVPVAIVFILLQRYYVRGMTLSGMK